MIIIMKRTLLLSFLFTVLYLSVVMAQTNKNNATGSGTFSNPMNVQFGDPYVLHTQGTYYMYGTGDRKSVV